MKLLFRALALSLLLIAVIQWLGVGERIYHAIWQWYKFSGYSNNGQTTVSFNMATFTFLASLAAIIIGWFIYKKSNDSFSSNTAKYSSFSLLFGIVSFSILIISPIAELVQR